MFSVGCFAKSAAVRWLGMVLPALAIAGAPAAAAAADIGSAFGPVPAANAAVSQAPFVQPAANGGFHALFAKWSRMDNIQKGAISIPSAQPVSRFILTSFFGVRADPFEGSARMHAGLDMAAPAGTPVYATADGVVAHAGPSNGYGNLVEIDHGRGVHTRYGHLSAVLVAENSRVHRGDLIGRVGSTGRSTGPHLHYEVRLDDRAINPLPFLQGASYLMAMKDPSANNVAQVALATNPPPAGDISTTAMGGPED
ncbi:MAG: M23 family metallopeptidase [Sphingomonadaceae bacterium]|nr:M23 family metallopeptidase [Sphingomonadaceae bacterium]